MGAVSRPGPESLRVLLVVGSLRRGGTEGQVAALARGMVARNLCPRILCLDAGGPVAEGVAAEGIPIIECNFKGYRTVRHPAAFAASLSAMLRPFRRPVPDVVHSFLPVGNLVGVSLGWLTRVPIVIASHRSLTDVRSLSGVLGVWERAVLRSADAVLCNSDAVLRSALAAGEPIAGKAWVVRNGVQARPEKPPPDLAAPRGLVIANLIGYKGHRVLFEALALAERRSRPGGIRIALAGAGPEEPQLRSLVDRLAISSSVDFLGQVEDIWAELDRSSFTVLPSLSEGMPNAALESMAAGRAVIASSVGGTVELLADGGGILVPPGDPDALAAAMIELATNPKLVHRLGAQGRAIARSRYTMERMIDETLSLYMKLLQRRGGEIDGARGIGSRVLHVRRGA